MKLTTNDFIERARKIHGDKYDYSLVNYTYADVKVKIICPIHGIFEQLPTQHINRKCGCNKCKYKIIAEKRKTPIEVFIPKVKQIFPDYDYSLVDYKNNCTRVKVICPIHGEFEQYPSKLLIGKGCQECGKIKQLEKQTKTKEQFIKEAEKIHNNKYDYSQMEYKNTHTNVKIICPIHGAFLQTPNTHLRGGGCPKCGFERTREKRTMSQNDFINRAKTIFPQYDYSKVIYKNSHTKVLITCPEHGSFETLPDSLINGNHGCPMCGVSKRAKQRTKTTEQFIKDAKEVHGDKYDYSLVEYKNTKTKVKIICHNHGVFEQVAGDHLCGYGCPYCNNSHGENSISNWLNNHNFMINKDYFREYKFKELGLKRYDFYIPSKNLLIEYNGKQHYVIDSYNNSKQKLKEQRHSDWIKRKFAKDKGIDLLIIPYTEFDNIETILENKIGSL